MANVTEYGYIGFDRAVERFEDKILKQVRRVVAETAEMMASQMKALAPVSTIDGGNLKRSIDVTYYNEGLTARINVGASYSLYVEFGTGIYAEDGDGRKTPWIYWSDKLGRYVFTRGMRPQPFFRPSYEQAAKFFKYEMNKIGV